MRPLFLLLGVLGGCDSVFGLISVDDVTGDVGTDGDDTLLESGLPPSAVVQVVANTSYCAFNQGVAVCPGMYDSHTCALRNDRSVWCWGSDRWGRLGFVPSDEAFERVGTPVFVPRRVDALVGKPVTAIAAGADHTCALLSDGQVYCWGYNWNGQLGITAGAETDGAAAGRGQPPGVAPLYTAAGPALVATSVEAGQGATCAGDSTGRVVCTGKANDKDIAAFATIPFAQLSMGWKTSCGVSTTNALYCSGDNASGQVLSGGLAVEEQTLMIPGGVADVRVGYSHICARFATDVFCWGNGAAFGMGNSFSFDNRQKIGSGSGAGGTAIARFEASAGNTCWVEQGEATCAGSGSAAPSGVVSTDSGSLANVRDIALSLTHGCALTTAGEVHCFGSNTYGQLGRDPIVTPTSLTALPVVIPD